MQLNSVDSKMASLRKLLKQSIKSSFGSLLDVFGKTRLGAHAYETMLNSAMGKTKTIIHNDVKLSFCTPNGLNRFRVDSFSTKEPETLEWIDTMQSGSVLWDIGANIGLYSCYAAKKNRVSVYAFEPSVFNLELLARNIFMNHLVDKVIIVPLPLSDMVKISTLNMTTMEWGGALSSFGENYGDDGKEMKKAFEFSSIGLSMDKAVSHLNIPPPTHIKIDVDGIEHLILSGGHSVLSQVKEVAIEVNEDFSLQTVNVEKHMKEAGLIFKEKRHSAMFDNNIRFGNTFNQVWHRI